MVYNIRHDGYTELPFRHCPIALTTRPLHALTAMVSSKSQRADATLASQVNMPPVGRPFDILLVG